MVRTRLILLLAVILTFAVTAAALAGETAKTAGGVAKAEARVAVCPGCGMEGGVCAGCEEHVREFLAEHSRYMCPGCTEDKLCDDFKTLIDDVIDRLPLLETEQVELAPMRIAYVEGTPKDMEGMFGKLMEAAVGQNLMSMDTKIGSAYTTLLSDGYSDDMPCYALISVPEGREVKEPLETEDFPGGAYFKVVHHGSYQKLQATWIAAIAYADLTGVQIGKGPAGEIYVNNPSNASEDELLTELYLPLAITEEAKSAETPAPVQAVNEDEAAPEPPVAPEAPACPDCKPGEKLCKQCAEHVVAYLSELSPKMCTDCKPGQPCKNCQEMIQKAVQALPAVEEEAHVISMDPTRVGYIGGTMKSDIAGMFTTLVTEAAKQNLMVPETMVCSIYPKMLSEKFTMDQPVYACITLGMDAKPVKPIEVYTAPGGPYLNIVHHGPYENLSVSWMAGMAYAELRGMKMGTGPCAEIYFNNPSNAKPEELRTELFLPLAEE
jgi:AraC family transcriptional regulator